MIKTPNAGSTAKGGIIGRRKRVLPEPASYVTMWQGGQLVRCLLSEARKSAPEATLAECENDPVKSGRNAGVFGVRKSPEPPTTLRCRYCGAAAPLGPQICTDCEKIRDRHEAAAEGWIGDDKLYLQVQRTLANRERAEAAKRFEKHGPGRLEREGPAVRVSDAVAKAKRTARAKVRQRTTGQRTTGDAGDAGDVLPEAAE
jgi:hypothetical protein